MEGNILIAINSSKFLMWKQRIRVGIGYNSILHQIDVGAMVNKNGETRWNIYG